jgi:hypothetical protein
LKLLFRLSKHKYYQNIQKIDRLQTTRIFPKKGNPSLFWKIHSTILQKLYTIKKSAAVWLHEISLILVPYSKNPATFEGSRFVQYDKRYEV